jgi:antitoxin (DNA-binding transcriptional repressor) of toxin-antitoxin stability system
MRRRITQRELRNDSGRIMRDLDRGRAFIVTRNGVPVGELSPMRQRVFVPTETVLAAFAGAPRIARTRFRRDVDAVIDQIPPPWLSRASRGLIDTSVVPKSR